MGKGKKVVLIILCLIAVFLSIEIIFRVIWYFKATNIQRDVDGMEIKGSLKKIHNFMYYDENECFRIKPNTCGYHRSYDDPEGTIVININSHGLRGPEILKSPDMRIAFIGDSIVFDGGVPLKNTFVYELEKLLNDAGDKRKAYTKEILNCGTTDVGIRQYYRKIKYDILRFKPQFIFLGFYLNDAVSPQGFIGIESLDCIERFLGSDFLSKFKFVNYLERLYRTGKYVNREKFRQRFRWANRFKKGGYYKEKMELITLIDEADLDWGSAWLPESWEKVKFYLKKIKKICKQEKITLVLFCFPAEPQVYSNVQWSNVNYPQRRLCELTEELSIPFFDLLPYLKKHTDISLYNDQCHYNVAGNRVLTEILFEIINNNADLFDF